MSFFDKDSALQFSQYLKSPEETGSIDLLGQGFNGRGAVLTLTSPDGSSRNLFLKVTDPHGFGNETSARRLSRHIAAAEPYPHSVPIHGVFAIDDGGRVLAEVSRIYETVTVSELIVGSESYLAQLRKPDTTSGDVAERALIMAQAMAEIHSIKHGGSEDEKRDLYLYATNSIIHDGELMPGVRDFSLKKGDTWMNSRQYSQLMRNMMIVREEIGPRTDRLSRIQGDFWASNIFFDKDDNISIIDSRTVWGEPAIDAAWMIGEFCMQDMLREGRFGGAFAHVVIDALAQYKEQTGDCDIERYMHLPYAFQTFAEAVFTPDLTDKQRLKMAAVGNGALLASMRGEVFDMMNLNKYMQEGLEDLQNAK